MARWTISGPRAKMVTSYRANSDYNWPICAPASNVKRANRVHVGQSKSSQSRRKYRFFQRLSLSYVNYIKKSGGFNSGVLYSAI